MYSGSIRQIWQHRSDAGRIPADSLADDLSVTSCCEITPRFTMLIMSKDLGYSFQGEEGVVSDEPEFHLVVGEVSLSHLVS